MWGGMRWGRAGVALAAHLSCGRPGASMRRFLFPLTPPPPHDFLFPFHWQPATTRIQRFLFFPSHAVPPIDGGAPSRPKPGGAAAGACRAVGPLRHRHTHTQPKTQSRPCGLGSRRALRDGAPPSLARPPEIRTRAR